MRAATGPASSRFTPRPQTPPATPRARAFYLTHAYVFALEAGDPRAAALKARLVAEGADRAD
jgi:hypothetical protein